VPPTLQLEKRKADRGKDVVMVPSAERAAFEMVPAEFVRKFPVLLLDWPAAPRERDKRSPRLRAGRTRRAQSFIDRSSTQAGDVGIAITLVSTATAAIDRCVTVTNVAFGYVGVAGVQFKLDGRHDRAVLEDVGYDHGVEWESHVDGRRSGRSPRYPLHRRRSPSPSTTPIRRARALRSPREPTGRLYPAPRSLPFAREAAHVGDVTYDPATRRIFMSQCFPMVSTQ
jgi:hypothetical protein